MKKAICLLVAVMTMLFAVSCGADDNKSAKKAESTHGPDYDPYAIIDYNDPIVTEEYDDVSAPKLNIDLDGANELSEALHKEYAEAGKAELTCEFEVQYDVVQIIITEKNGDKTVKKVFYYDALTDTEIEFADFVSYCAVSYNDLLEAVKSQLGTEDIDEDYVDGIIYYGNDEFDILATHHTASGNTEVYRATVEKTEIEMPVDENALVIG